MSIFVAKHYVMHYDSKGYFRIWHFISYRGCYVPGTERYYTLVRAMFVADSLRRFFPDRSIIVLSY